jgi:hypothetical protein
MRRLGKAASIAVAGSAALAGAAQAQSLTIAPLKPCYLTGEEVTMTAAGFTPGGLVDFAVDGRALGPLVADPAGTAVGALTLGGMRGAKSHGFSATDQANPALVANAASSAPRARSSSSPRTLRPVRRGASRATAS